VYSNPRESAIEASLCKPLELSGVVLDEGSIPFTRSTFSATEVWVYGVWVYAKVWGGGGVVSARAVPAIRRAIVSDGQQKMSAEYHRGAGNP